jgi:LPXTG-motif cell wall-anchored protein
MNFDIRLPIGALFTIVGALLAVYGALTGASTATGSRGLQVNAWWGAALLLFGVAMLWLARRRRRG